MSDKLSIQITATDGASRVFQQVASGAERLDQSLDRAGDGFKDFSRDSDTSTRSLREWESVGRDIGISLGVLATGMSLAGRAFRDQEVALRTLERGYGDAATELEAFSEAIQANTNFSNDQAIAAANTFRTLADNYGFTTAQIQELISISADLAATMGIGLEDAAFRVQSAMRGEAEAAEYLGLTLNDRALGLDKVSTSMSEAERAQIRFNALQEQSAFALGTAAEQADTTYGSMTQLRDSVQDAAQAFGDFLGPVGEIGAFAADNAIQIAAMGLALGQLGKTAAGINEVSKALTGLNAARLGLSGLTALMTGPAGIIVAAGLAGVAINQFAGDLGPTFQQAADGAIESVDALIEKIVELGDTSALANTVLGLDTITIEFQKINDDANVVIGTIGALIAEAQMMDDANAETVEGLLMASGAFDGLSVAVRNNIDANGDGIATLEELRNAQAFYNDEAIRTKEVLDGLNAGADELGAIFVMTGEGAAFAKSEANAYTEALLEGEITGQRYEELLQSLITGYGDVQEETSAAGASIEESTAAVEGWMTAGGEVVTLNDDIAKSMQELGQQSVELGDVLVRSTDPFILRQSEMLDGIQAQMVAMGNLSTRLAGIEGPSTDAQGAQDLQGMIQGARAAQDGLAVSIENAADAMTYQVGESARLAAELAEQAEQVTQLREEYTATFEQMQADATRASDTLETVFGAIVGNTDAIAKQSQEVADWSAGLTVATDHLDEWGNSLGWWSLADELVYDAAITQEQYNAAVQANTDIQAANYSIQRDVLSIQAQLAPVIATATEALAAQMDEIANGSTDAQLFALGMMDAATSSQALQLATSYLADQDTFGPMIQQAAELNPMLAQILEEMGLISYNPATGQVTLLGVDEAMSDLDRMTAAMDGLNHSVLTLVAILDDDPFTNSAADVEAKLQDLDAAEATSTVNADTSNAQSGFALANELLGAWDGSTGTANANVNDNASGTLSNISALLNSLDGRSVTSYATVIQQTIGGGAIFGLGGVVGSYAAGGVVAEMAEWGPELLHFPNGGVALAKQRGIYTVPQGTYVDTAPATAAKLNTAPTFQFVNNGTIIGIDDLEAQIAESFSRAWVRGNRQHERSMGALGA